MTDERELLRRTADIAADFLETLDERPVFPAISLDALAERLAEPLPEGPTHPLEVIEALARDADPGIVATAGSRYFGYVIGGAVPASVAADWLTSVWDQCAAFSVLSPAASVIEEIVGDWLKDLLGLPAHASFALTTGCQMAHVTALAAARHAVLERRGWDVRERGLAGSPPIAVVAGAKRHVTLDRALRLLGIGDAQIVVVPADDQGRMLPDELEQALAGVEGPAIVAVQAGEVNTGASDPFPAIVQIARAADAWVHVDGAFGLWAAASPRRRHLVEGVAGADSWAADAHKSLSVPYDCGLVFCARPAAHNASMTMKASYFEGHGKWARDAFDWTPESSRRARALTVYAALRSLGRRGVEELVETCCVRAEQFASALVRLPGCTILNDVVLNQVLFRFVDDEATSAVLSRVQESGEAWMGGTVWEDRQAIRISVSSWRTSERDVERTVAAFSRALAEATSGRV